MKLICVKDGIVKIKDVYSNTVREHKGEGLKQGETYETNAKPFVDELGHENYYIVGLGSKLKLRFAELLDNTPKEEIIQYSIKNPVLNNN